MRYLAALAMVALALATVLSPQPGPVPTRPLPGEEPSPVAICPVVEATQRETDILVLAPVDGEGRLSAFSHGEETGAIDFAAGESGAARIAASRVEAVGIAGALVELPMAPTASGAVVSGPDSLAAEACADSPGARVFISGGSTAGADAFEIHLINPYAADANVSLTVSTDAGIESSDRFTSFIVPALSSFALDMTQIIPGREEISASIETTRGAVLAYGRQTIEGETALWRALEPGQDWWLPVPPGDGNRQLTIATPENTEIDYQVDLYLPDGVEEAHTIGTIDPRGLVRVPLDAVTEEALGVKVITTGTVVAGLWMDSEAGLAVTTGSQVDAPLWLLPGAAAPEEGTGSIVVLNTGLDMVTVSVIPLGGSAEAVDFELDAVGVLVAELDDADGYRVEATGPVVVLWTAQSEGAGSAAIGVPFQDG
jgi:hypothetical protein